MHLSATDWYNIVVSVAFILQTVFHVQSRIQLKNITSPKTNPLVIAEDVFNNLVAQSSQQNSVSPSQPNQ